MTGAQIITNFELQVSDITEMSTVEELVIVNRVYQFICSSRPWEFLKTTSTGSILTDATGSYITLPTDFMFFSENLDGKKVIFTGTGLTENKIVSFSDRRGYLAQSNVAYLSLSESKIRFIVAPVSTETTFEFDYVKAPTDITGATEPLFPSRFHELLVYGMAADNDILQLSPKAKSYQSENNQKFSNLLENMEFWNANLQII